MDLEYQGWPDLLLRLGQMLSGMAMTAAFASFAALIGSPMNKYVKQFSLAISGALRDDVQIARDEAAKTAAKEAPKEAAKESAKAAASAAQR